MSGQDQQIRCARCGQSTPGYEIVHYGSMEQGYREICLQCLNREMAEAMGLEGFEHAKFEPVGLTDCAGEVHEFHFRTNLFGPGVSIDALSYATDTRLATSFRLSVSRRMICSCCWGN